MLDCRRCRNWVDESFSQLYEESQNGLASESLFYGCRIFGRLEVFQLEECAEYSESEELFRVCSSCGIATPKVCHSLGECINCTDTDLFCVDHCHGEGEKKFCSHFQRLVRDGLTLIEDNNCFEIYAVRQASTNKDACVSPILSLFPKK